MKKLALTFATLGLAAASAASTYKVTLHQPTLIAGKELKPGVYKVEVNDTTARLSQGKESVEAPVKTETAESKFRDTSVRYRNGDGKYRIEEIRIGGTATKLVFAN
ncbi:MAG TPA: hypothetical protein VER03_00225 [Bryobacteraceae bacterium]|nr:hypothetical protein [Bryobacteraceae bacterium]